MSEKRTPGPESGPGAPGSAGDAGGGMQIRGGTGPTKPYYEIKLVRLPKHPTVNAFIGDAEVAMQKSVNVLGFGRSDPPPAPMNGKTPDKVQAATLQGSGKGLDLYKQQVSSAGTRQDSMVDMDTQVDGTSRMVAAEQAQTLFTIQHIEAELNTALSSVSAKKLTHAEEATVMDHIAAAVKKVHDTVQAAQDVNVGAAGGDSGSGGSSGGGTSAGAAGGAAGGADGGLGSMLPMLAMLPMALLPMLGQLPELLGQKDDKDEEDKEDGEAPPSEPAPSPGPAPTDPTASAPGGATAPPGDTPPQNPAPGTPQGEIPYGPTSPSKQV
ncbi:hypothetical protein [Nocardia sp. NBC_00416]|uniref:hypothetical protein n=1 Tax=Nocardia sp. NBC_00416 TaxID=2975991 RepID=UPI002E226269